MNPSLVSDILSGNRLALARLLTQVENDTPEGRVALDALYAHTGRAHLIGVTGAPGTGKSSLVNQMALVYRKAEQPKKVAIVAVDPSSPFTGGAVLGDRVRMRDLSGDPGVFVRSMASRGSLGGLAQSTAAVAQVFDAAGFEVVLIETVGAGQTEVDIARLAHTTLVVEAPGLGDDIQAIKAGILEIADIIVVNKADRPGVENTLRALRIMLDLAHPVAKVFLHHGQAMADGPVRRPQNPQNLSQRDAPQGGETEAGPGAALWIPLLLKTVATDGTGVPELVAAISRHADFLRETGDWVSRDRARLEAEFETLLREMLVTRFRESESGARYQDMLDRIASRELSPWEAARHLLNGRKG
jgi:LAO/AO transport system kinase